MTIQLPLWLKQLLLFGENRGAWRVPYPTTRRMSSLDVHFERRVRMSRSLHACHLHLVYSEDP